jgi:hypothetical protein
VSRRQDDYDDGYEDAMYGDRRRRYRSAAYNLGYRDGREDYPYPYRPLSAGEELATWRRSATTASLILTFRLLVLPCLGFGFLFLLMPAGLASSPTKPPPP